MAESDEFAQDTRHCGRHGCSCHHAYCDRGFQYVTPRRVVTVRRGEDGQDVEHVAEYERVAPCPMCKPGSYEAMGRAADRADQGRLLRRVKDRG